MYVLVDFPQYCGPSFYDSENTELKSERDTKRTWVPVPSVLGRCSNNGACAKLYMPLSLAFGKQSTVFKELVWARQHLEDQITLLKE